MSNTNKILKQTKKKCVDCDLFSIEVSQSTKYKLNLCAQCLVARLISDK